MVSLSGFRKSLTSFHHSIRQYTRRLKDWGILKNLKAHEKEAIIAKIAEARAQNRTVIGVKFNKKSVDIARLRRYSCSKLKQTNRRNRKMKVESSTLDAPQYRIELIFENDVIESEEIVNCEKDFTPEGSCANNQIQATGSLPSAGLVSEHASVNNRRLGTINSNVSLPRKFNSSGPIENLEGILKLTQIFIAVSASEGGFLPIRNSNIGFPANASPIHPPEMMKFWTDVKNSIYFLKLGPKEEFSARSLVSEACHQLNSSPGVSIDITILKELFCTLSHANTGIYPNIRTFILGNLISIFKRLLGPNHPLPRLCWYLHNATPATNVSERALRLALDILGKHLGPDHTNVLDTRRALIRQFRRSGDLDSAEVHCKLQIESTERLPDQSSSAVRKTKSELVHIYMKKKNFSLAEKLCQSIVDSGKGCRFIDETTIYAMEDLAELRKLMGDKDGCLELLSVAHDGAFGLWGCEASPTICISRKIQALGVS